MTSFWHAYWWSLRTFCMLYFSISCVQTTTDANIGCKLQFLNAKSLVIPAKESGVETQTHILAALQVENENACAQFCCDFDLEESKVKCGAAVFEAGKHSRHLLDSEEESSQHNCFLFNCSPPEDQNCKTFQNATDAVTTILVDHKNELPSAGGETQNAVPPSVFRVPAGYSQSETTSSTNALLLTLVILIGCIALVAGVVMSNYLYQQYQKRKLYYKLDKMDGNGDFFSSEDRYNYNE